MKSPVALLLGVLVVLAGCTPQATSTTPATTGASVTEKRSADQVLRYAVDSLPVSMSIEATETAREQYYMLYDTVVTKNQNNEVLPWAATKWELINPTTWRLSLRNDLTFS